MANIIGSFLHGKVKYSSYVRSHQYIEEMCVLEYFQMSDTTDL